MTDDKKTEPPSDVDRYHAFNESWGPPVRIPPRDPRNLGSEPSGFDIWLEGVFNKLPPRLRRRVRLVLVLLFLFAMFVGLWAVMWAMWGGLRG